MRNLRAVRDGADLPLVGDPRWRRFHFGARAWTTVSAPDFRIAVEDRVARVAPEFVDDLFERFSRSDRSREQAAGSGLGLAIARAYARAHNGDISYRTARPRGP